ncbi:hypothetical protein OG900_27330 [Streptomyces sp. NBC_00433]
MLEHEGLGQEQANAAERVPDPSARPHPGSLPAAGVLEVPSRSAAGAGTVLSMQRMAGNAAVTRWLSAAGPGSGRRLDGHVVQRDDDSAVVDTWSGSPPDAEQESADAGEGMTPDLFEGMFDPDTLAQEIADADDSDLGAADLVPDTPRTTDGQDSAPTAQALSLQRDPPANIDPAQKQTKPGGTGDVLKAVSSLPEVFPQLKLGLAQVKHMALTDWKMLVNDPVALSVSIPISVMIAAGVVVGVESSPDMRRTLNPQIFGKDFPVPVPDSVRGVKLPGLSVKIMGTGAEANGLVFTLDFGKVLGWKAPKALGQGDTAGGIQQ